MSTQSASIRLSREHKGRKRKEPVWIARYRLIGKDSAKVLGKAWTKRSRAPDGYLTRSQAEDALRRLLLAESTAPEGGRCATFREVADAYLETLEARIRTGSFRASTLRTYRNIIGRDLRPRWGDRPIASVALADVAAFHRDVVARGLAASTINQTRAVVHGIFALAIMRLVEAEASEQDAALLLTAAFTGLRASELRALRWRSVDAANSLIHVERGFTDEGGEDLPKSYRVRSVPMMPQVALALSKLRGREFFTDDDELVFASPTGSFLDYDQLARRYRSAQQRAGLRLLPFHDLRHSFGTMAVRQFPITDVQTWMGHADIATTRKYIHYAPQPEAAAKLGALVGEQLGQVAELRRAG